MPEFENLRDLILQDAKLQEELQNYADRETFVARVVEIAIENGLCLRNEDILGKMNENRRLWIERWI